MNSAIQGISSPNSQLGRLCQDNLDRLEHLRLRDETKSFWQPKSQIIRREQVLYKTTKQVQQQDKYYQDFYEINSQPVSTYQNALKNIQDKLIRSNFDNTTKGFVIEEIILKQTKQNDIEATIDGLQSIIGKLGLNLDIRESKSDRDFHSSIGGIVQQQRASGIRIENTNTQHCVFMFADLNFLNLLQGTKAQSIRAAIILQYLRSKVESQSKLEEFTSNYRKILNLLDQATKNEIQQKYRKNTMLKSNEVAYLFVLLPHRPSEEQLEEQINAVSQTCQVLINQNTIVPLGRHQNLDQRKIFDLSKWFITIAQTYSKMRGTSVYKAICKNMLGDFKMIQFPQPILASREIQIYQQMLISILSVDIANIWTQLFINYILADDPLKPKVPIPQRIQLNMSIPNPLCLRTIKDIADKIRRMDLDQDLDLKKIQLSLYNQSSFPCFAFDPEQKSLEIFSTEEIKRKNAKIIKIPSNCAYLVRFGDVRQKSFNILSRELNKQEVKKIYLTPFAYKSLWLDLYQEVCYLDEQDPQSKVLFKFANLIWKQICEINQSGEMYF